MSQTAQIEPASSAVTAPPDASAPPARRRFSLLFIFLLASLILYPFADNNVVGYYVLRVIGSAVILVSVYVVSYRRTFLVFAILLGVPATAERIWLLKSDPSALSMINIV